MLREVRFVRLLIDREKQFFFELEQFFLARVGVERKLRFIDRASLVRVFHHPEQLLVTRLTQFYFEHETSGSFDIALPKFLRRFAGYAIA